MKTKQVLLIMPTQLDEGGKPIYLKTAIYPPLPLAAVAALFPQDYQVRILDESIEPINFEEKVDLVGISATHPIAQRGFQIAKEFRKRGIKTIIGGPTASILPKKCAEYFDSVFIGEAEDTFLDFIDDFEMGGLKKFYQAKQRVDLNTVPVPRYDLFDKKKYGFLGKPIMPIQTTRGYPFNCAYCSMKKMYGQGLLKNPSIR